MRSRALTGVMVGRNDSRAADRDRRPGQPRKGQALACDAMPTAAASVTSDRLGRARDTSSPAFLVVAGRMRQRQAFMIHVVTVHFMDDRWIGPQLRFLNRFLPTERSITACLNGIDPRWAPCFDHTVDLDGEHADKLNALADIVTSGVPRPTTAAVHRR